MLQAYVGIVSCNGIELFCPEDPATVRFLWRRVQRHPYRVACFWSVLPSDAVELVEAALLQGFPQHALDLIQQQARDYGFLTTPDGDESTSRSAAHCRR
jgi:hypothetical protein